MRRVLTVSAILVVVAAAIVWWLQVRGADRPKAASGSGTSGTSAPHVAKPRIPAKPATVSGKVTRKADGAGVAAAVVSLAHAELGADLQSSSAPTIIVAADANGAWSAKDIAPGDYVIAASARGLLPAAREKLTIASGEQKTGIDFALEAGGTAVRGTVSDVGGGPIASARVTAKRESFSLQQGAEYVALTGADGTYELSLPDDNYRLLAAHDEYTHDSKDIDVEGKPLTVDFTLIPGASIKGQVIARDTGKPLPHALVKATHGHSMREGREATAITDDDGNFVVHALSSGTISLDARGHGYASASPATVQLGIGEQVEGIQVLVDRAYSISGRVVKKGTQQGIAGARLGAFSMSQGSQGEAPEPSDENGAFEIPGLRPGSFMLYAAAEGTMLEIGKNVEIVDKDVTDVIVELSSGVTLSGRVEPPMVATVALELEGEVGIANMFEMIKAAMCRGQSDASGTFKLVNAPPGKFKLVAKAKDGTTGKLPITIAALDQSGLVVQMTPRASIAGKVVDSSGKPVAGIEVQADAKDDKPMKISFMDERQAKTATDGTFKLVGLDAGKYEVHARWPGDWMMYMDRDKDKKDDKPDKKKALVELAEGMAKTGVVLTVDARDGVIRGQVIAPDGKPAADAWVSARREFEKPAGIPDEMEDKFSWFSDTEPVLTNADGKFVIANLQKGNYTLIADGPRGTSHGEKKNVKTGDTTTVNLTTLGTLTVKVTQSNAPVKQYDVTCDGPTDIERHAESADGTYKLEHLAPGDYKCRVRADGGTAEGKASVPAGDAQLALTIAPWGSLTGMVVSVLNGKPVAGLSAVPNSEDNEGGFVDAMLGRGAKTDANGRFVVERVPAGKGHLVLVPPNGNMMQMDSHEYTARAGERVDMGTIKIVPPRTGEAGTFGLTTEVKGDALEVTNVKDDGPAAQVGVKAGDKITAVEGQPLKGLGAALAQKVLSSGSPGVGDSIAITLERGPTVTLTAVKW